MTLLLIVANFVKILPVVQRLRGELQFLAISKGGQAEGEHVPVGTATEELPSEDKYVILS
jgi:hypothetical protein